MVYYTIWFHDFNRGLRENSRQPVVSPRAVALDSIHRRTALGMALVPVALAIVLNVLRPDLIAPMAGHLFGYVAAGSIILLGVAGAGGALFGWWLVDRFTKRFRIFLTLLAGVLPFLLFTAPALFLTLFSPIVFAFMYGELPPVAQTEKPVRPPDTSSLIREYPER